MTNNERKLGLALGGVVGLYFGYLAINTIYLKPRGDLAAQVAAQKARHERLLGEMNRIEATRKEWKTQTGRTLSGSADAAHKQFRDEVAKLLRAHQLSEGHTLTPQQAREIKKESKKGFIELPIAINTEGTLKEVTTFLEAVQKLPYYVSVDKVVLNPNAAEQGLAAVNKSKRPKPGAADGPLIKVQMTLSTLVLPKVGDQAHEVCDLSKPDLSPALAPRDVESEYTVVSATNLFKPWEAPPPPPPPPPPPDDGKKPEKTHTPPTPPPAPQDTRVLVGTPSLNGEPIAYFQSEDRAQEPDEMRLNAVVGEHGKLVLIHPLGIVIREKKPSDPMARNYFVPLGEKMSDRQELSPSDHPDVAALLARVLPLQ